MYITPDFGTTQWIAEYCSTTGMNPDIMLGALLTSLALLFICATYMFSLLDDLKRLKKFLINHNMLQAHEQYKRNKEN